MKKLFEDYLKEIHAKDFAEGVLDDDMPDHFDNWISQLEPDQLIEYANTAMLKQEASFSLNLDAI